MKRTGAIVFFGILYVIAAQIGNTFQQSLTILSVMVWMIAGVLFTYLVLYRGVKFNPFAKAEKPAVADEFAEFDGPGDGDGKVVALPVSPAGADRHGD